MVMVMVMAMAMASTFRTPLKIGRRGAIRQHQFSVCAPPTAPLLIPTCGRRSLSHQRCLFLPANKPCKVFCSQVKLEDVDDEACELVSGVELILGDGADGFRAYLLTAVKNNNGTGVLILSDVYGYEASSTRDFAYRIACNGYNVLVPDVFRGNPWIRERNRSEFDDWVAEHPAERIAKDVNISAKWMADEFLEGGISKKLGIIGFCFGGGRLIDTLAQDGGDYFSTAACFYGTHMDLSLAADIKIPVLFISGDSDPLCPVETLRDFEKCIGKGSRVVVFKDQVHAFVHMPESAEADREAEAAFMITRNWLQEGLIVKK